MAFWDSFKEIGVPILGGAGASLFGDSGKGYNKSARIMEEMLNKASQYYQPYRQAGEEAIPQFQGWMNQYRDPKQFLTNVFSDYNLSPGAKYQINQAERAANNAASASGLTGSSAHMREAGNIANQVTSQDMQQYLQNILGIGNNYGQSLNSLINQGLNAAGGSAGLYGQGAGRLGELYGSGTAARQNQMNQLFAMALQSLPYIL